MSVAWNTQFLSVAWNAQVFSTKSYTTYSHKIFTFDSIPLTTACTDISSKWHTETNSHKHIFKQNTQTHTSLLQLPCNGAGRGGRWCETSISRLAALSGWSRYQPWPTCPDKQLQEADLPPSNAPLNAREQNTHTHTTMVEPTRKNWKIAT